ncbi:ABC transporter ATP-binding protein [Pseudonocardia pini]|uniref:ABC transporter ATP-binding protein n=1 Tax=Pseudonocardia pini TaxID=2758030 RepID=UPI0015F10B7B|nr:ABC transporter ATP-binding protein [Pseudonocardia pini]
MGTETAPSTLSTAPALEARGLSVGYGGRPVVDAIDLTVRGGEVALLLGPNGAGKTTTLLGLAGELSPLSGSVRLAGATAPPGLHRRARSGVAFVTEERSVFMELTVEENLRVGRCEVAAVVRLFPEIEPLLSRRCGLLSGGEQQMVTLGRALARSPKVLLVDELSLGLAPLVVERLLAAVREAADRGTAVVLVEQHVDRAMRVADHVLVLERGRVVLNGSAADLAGRVKDIEASYLAAAGTEPSGAEQTATTTRTE